MSTSSMNVPIECPNCRRKITKRLDQLKANHEFRCACGAAIKIEGRGFEQVGREIKNLEKSIKKLGGSRR